MTTSLPPEASRKRPIAIGVAAASLTYSASLVAQRAFPPLKDALAISLGDGVAPTYYLRVAVSLFVGLALAAVVPKRPLSEPVLTWATGAAIFASAVLICLFP